MLRIVVLFCAGVVVAHAQTTAVSQCTYNPGGLPINAYIEGCTTPPCMLPQLQYCVVDVIFRAPRTMRSMRTLATAQLSLGIFPLPPIPYELGDNAVTCNFLTNSYCPVIEGEVLRYTLKMFIEPFFPVNASPNVEFRVVDENNEPVWCVRIPITIVPPVEGTSSGRNVTVVIDDNNV